MIAVRNFVTVYAKVVALRHDIGMIQLDPNYEGYQYAIDHVNVPKNMFGGMEVRIGDIFGLMYSEIEEGNPVLTEVNYVIHNEEVQTIKYDPKEGGF